MKFFLLKQLLSLFVISLVLSLNFSVSDTRSLGSVAKWNLTLLLKHHFISASLCSSLPMPVTHSVLTNLPKNVFSRSFWRKYVFPDALLPTTNIFPRNRPSETWLISNFHFFLVILLLLNFLSAAKLVSLKKIVMVVEHMLILIPLIFHTNLRHNFLMIKTHTFFLFFFFFWIFIWRSAQCFSFSSLTLFNKKCLNGREVFRCENKNVYRLTQQPESF